MYYIFIPVLSFIVILIALMCINISVNIICRSNSEKKAESEDKGETDLRVFARYAFFTFHILPEKVKKADKADKKKRSEAGEKADKSGKSIEKIKDEFLGKAYTIADIVELIKQIAGTLLTNFQKHLKLRIKKFYVIVASEDAQKTALIYGTVQQSVYYLYEFLNQHFRISHDDMKVYSDFSKSEIAYDIDMKFSIRLGHALKMALLTVIKYQRFDKNKEDKDDK